MPGHRHFVWMLCFTLSLPVPTFADGSASGRPICTMPGNQLALFAMPATLPGYNAVPGALLLWQDQRGGPADPAEVWGTLLNEAILFSGDVLPADGFAVVERPGPQAQQVAARVSPWACPYQFGCLTSVIAYTDNDGVHPHQAIRAKRMWDPFATWDVAASLTPRDCFVPYVVDDATPLPGGGSGAILSWLEQLPGDEPQLRAQRLGFDGARLWGDLGIAVIDDSTGQSDAAMAAAPGGGAFFAWLDYRFGSGDALFAMRLTAEGVPAPGWPPGGRPVLPSTAARSPRLLADGDGGVFVLWEQYEPLADQSQGQQPRLLRLLGDGSLAPGWPGEGLRLVVRDDVSLQVDDLRADGAGGACVAMRSFDGTTSRVIVQRVLASGTRPAGWPDAGRAACTGPGSEYGSRLSAEAGVVTVVWSDARAGELDLRIVAARFLADGTRAPGWPADGLVVGDDVGSQYSPVVFPGMAGGVVVAWVDDRRGAESGTDLYANCVNAAGRLDVGSTGVPTSLGLSFASAQPARGAMRFRLALPVTGPVRAEVFDLLGRRVARLEDGVLPAGEHVLEWSGRDESGAGVPPGVRFLRVRTAAGERTLRFASLR